MVNTSIDSASAGSIQSAARGVQEWDLRTGEIRPYAFQREADGLKCEFKLAPCGSLLLFLSKEASDPAPPVVAKETPVPPAGSLEVRRLDPNVLTLDYVDVTVKGETKKNVYFYQAGHFIFRQHGMAGNPWDSCVQFGDELISRKFPSDSGFEATYRFTVRDRVPSKLEIVIERPDLYSISCNGKPLKATPEAWWLDRCFGRIDITAVTQVGDNAVTIAASPMTIQHELEPAYLLGDFALESTDSGFVVVADRPLSVEQRPGHGNAIEGTMWLSAGIGYQRDPKAKEGNDGDPFVVFDLGRDAELCGITVWNYNEINQAERGVKELAIQGANSAEPDSFADLGQFQLARSSGDAAGQGQTLAVNNPRVRYVKFDILSNQRGVKYPTAEAGPDSAFVGLSEVRFLENREGRPQEISGVVISKASSELAGTHDRKPQHLLDGSGLGNERRRLE